jgi:hypothetical protein
MGVMGLGLTVVGGLALVVVVLGAGAFGMGWFTPAVDRVVVTQGIELDLPGP